MKPRVYSQDGWWKVAHGPAPKPPVAYYDTWERAMNYVHTFHNVHATKAASARAKEYAAWR